MKIVYRVGLSTLTFSLLITGLFIFTAWKAVDESPAFSARPIIDDQVHQSNLNIAVDLEDQETEVCLPLKKNALSNDSEILEAWQPYPELIFFARTFSPSSTSLLQYSGITPYILDMSTVNQSRTDRNLDKKSGNLLLPGDYPNREDDGVGDQLSFRQLQRGDVTPPIWLSGSDADRSSNTMKIDMTNGVVDHSNNSLPTQTFKKYGTGLDTIPPPKQTDTLIIDMGQADEADPGDRIRYKVTIENIGMNDANDVQLNISPDPRTTLLPGSFRSSPLAVNDAYSCTGNVGINVPAVSGLKANDFDDDIGGAMITAGTFGTTGGGTIVINADGSFMYTPAAGFTGPDTYIYSLNDGNGVGDGVPSVDMATVTITVSALIWFIDNSSVAGTEDGRLNTPFKSITNFNASALPAAGQVIFIKQTGMLYSGGFVLKNNQYLFGSGHSGGSNLASIGVLPFTVPAHSFTLPNINGTRTLFRNSSGIGITLASGNTIRGIEVGRCGAAKISGNAFGTLTIGNTTGPDVALTGNQQALSLTNGTFATTSKFAGISCPDSSRVVLNTVSGSLASASTEVNAFGSGGSITIDIQNSSASLDFGNTTANNFNGQTVISITNSATGTVTFSNLSMPNATNGTGLLANNGGTINIGGTSSAITARLALDITNTSFGSGATFASISSTSSSGKGVNLDNVTGPVVINGGSITNSAGIAFDVNAGSSTVTYAGTVNNANRAVEVTGRTGGTVTFSGNIANTGTGINVANNTGGTVAFSGVSKSLNTGANAAVTLTVNTGATINFTGGGLIINTTSGTGFSATGGATSITVQGTGNTINSISATALNVVNTTVGGSNLNFESITSGNNSAAADPTNGIVLNNTGTSGGLTVTGTGSAASGGTIQSTSGVGVLMTTTSNVSLNWMQISNTGAQGISGITMTDGTGGVKPTFEIVNSRLTSPGDADNEDAMFFGNIATPGNNTGKIRVAHTIVEQFEENGLQVYNNTGTLTVEVTGTLSGLTNSTCKFDDNNDTHGQQGILITAAGTANITNDVNGVYFNNIEFAALDIRSEGTSAKVDVNWIGNLSVNGGGPDNFPSGGGFQIVQDVGGGANFDIKGNNIRDLPGDGIVIIAEGPTQGRIGGDNPADGNVVSGSLGDGIRIDTDQLAGSGNPGPCISFTVTVLIKNNNIGNDPTFPSLGDDGIQILHRDCTKTLNLTIENNKIANAASEAIRYFTDADNSTGALQPKNFVRVANNSISNIGVADAFFFQTQDSAEGCFHITGNSFTGINKNISLNQSAGNLLQITQASLAALAAANSGSTTSNTGTISFNGTCTNPALPSNP